METISLQALTSPPSAICIVGMLDAAVNKTSETLFVNIGLTNGLFLRTVLDPVTGELTDTRTRCVRLHHPLTYSYLCSQLPWHAAHPFEPCYYRWETCIARSVIADVAQLRAPRIAAPYTSHLRLAGLCQRFHGRSLSRRLHRSEGKHHQVSRETTIHPQRSWPTFLPCRIFQIPKIGQRLKHEVLPLTYTPRKMAVHPMNGLFYIAEADHRVYGADVVQGALQQPDLKKYDRDVLELPSDVFGHPRAPAGTWASCIRILDPVEVRIPLQNI